jgi:hypothetical protein
MDLKKFDVVYKKIESIERSIECRNKRRDLGVNDFKMLDIKLEETPLLTIFKYSMVF